MSKEYHGYSGTLIYARWISMKDRCLNINNPAYQRYGGRGITVCDRWLSFSAFLDDMGMPPEGMSLERVDNTKGYSPENCIWATKKEQSRNRRSVIKITVGGKTMNVVEWAKESNIPATVIYARISNGWDREKAVTFPNLGKRRDCIKWGARAYETDCGVANDVRFPPDPRQIAED